MVTKATDPLPEKDNDGIEETAAMESGLPVGKGSDYRQSVAGYSQWLTVAHSMRLGNRLFLPGWKNAMKGHKKTEICEVCDEYAPCNWCLRCLKVPRNLLQDHCSLEKCGWLYDDYKKHMQTCKARSCEICKCKGLTGKALRDCKGLTGDTARKEARRLGLV